ncbi:MAG: FecR domain-containing protein [Bacteroidales bacterium]|nr:FecR domain-containing protein [Bacteroidales bacterium]
MDVDDNKIINWAVKYHQGRMSPEEQKEFEIWLKNEPEHISLVNKYRKLYADSRGIAFHDKVQTEIAWNKIAEKISVKSKRLMPEWIYYAAAIFILGLISTWFIFNEVSKVSPVHHYNFEQLAEVGSKKATLRLADGTQLELHEKGEQHIDERDGTQILKDEANNLIYGGSDHTQNEIIYNEIYVPKAGEYSLVLSDGTQVWLNSDTRLRYPVQFGTDKREVYLVSGEACFKVAHNKEAPFSVYARDTKVKALGTMFNVSGYESQEFIATTLVEGSVQVDYLTEQTILEPGQQSIITRGKDGITVESVDATVYVAWIHGVFEFENADLEYLCDQLGRWYNLNIFFAEV